MPVTTACILVRSEMAFHFLGHKPVMSWVVDNVKEVRGIDRILYLAYPDFAKQVSKFVSHSGIEVVKVPNEVVTAKTDAILDKWLCSVNGPCSDVDRVVVIKPTSPFMPAAKIEACVNRISRGKATICVPSRERTVVGKTKKLVSPEAVDTVRAFKVQTIQEPDALPLIYATVSVSLIESLDVNFADEHRLAEAVVQSGLNS